MTSPGDGPAWDPARFTRRPAPTAPSAVTSELSPRGSEAPESGPLMPPPEPRVAAPVEDVSAAEADGSWRLSAPATVVATDELPDPFDAAVGSEGQTASVPPSRRRTMVVTGSVSAVLALAALAFAVGTMLRPGDTDGPPLAASSQGDSATDVPGEGEPEPAGVVREAGTGADPVAGSDLVSPDPADQTKPYAPPSATPFFTAIVTSRSEDDGGRAAAERFAARIEAAGHPAYVYRSDDYSHLRSGYWVASAGAFSTLDAARSAARALGDVFPDVELVYPRCVGDAGSCAGQD